MLSSKIKVENFLKIYPSCKSLLLSFIKKYENLVHDKEQEYKTEQLAEEAKKLCEYEITHFKKKVSSGFKYKLQLLNVNSYDYKVLKDSLVGTDALEDNQLIFDKATNDKIKIYRVDSAEKLSTASSTFKGSKVLLLHGTQAPNIKEILKIGFKPSQKGMLGPGVYHSDSISKASEYGKCWAQEKGVVKKFTYCFINQIENIGKLTPEKQFENEVLYYDDINEDSMSYQQYLKREPSLLACYFSENKSDSFQYRLNNKYDSKNRKILQGTFQRDFGYEKEVLAHHDLVVPAYLVEFSEKPTVGEIVDEVFDYILDKKSPNKVTEYTFETITKEMKREIIENKAAKIKSLESKLDENMRCIMEQLLFKFSSVTESKDNEKTKYKAESLLEQDSDYKFVLRSIASEKDRGNEKIKHVFKINPVDKNEELDLKDKYVFLHGVTSNRVKSILTEGYLKEYDENDVSYKNLFYNYSTTHLRNAINTGVSYCLVDNVVKKFSFVFVASSGVKYENFCMKDSKIVKDTRGSCVDVGKNRNFDKIISGFTPAYLIVFEL